MCVCANLTVNSLVLREGPKWPRLETCVCVCQLNCKFISFEGGPQKAKTRNVCVCVCEGPIRQTLETCVCANLTVNSLVLREGPKWPRLETCVCVCV